MASYTCRLILGLVALLTFSQSVHAALGEGLPELERRYGKPIDTIHYAAGELSPEVNRPVEMLILDKPGCQITVFVVDGKSCREFFAFEKAIASSEDPRIQGFLKQHPGDWKKWSPRRVRSYFQGIPPKYVWALGKDDLTAATDPRSFLIVDGEDPGKVEIQSPVWRAFLQ